MVIDSHAHVFEERKAARIMKEMGERAGVHARTDGTLRGLLASMEEAGVDLAFISRITTRPEQAARVNEWLLGLQGPKVLALATAHPYLPRAGEEVERLQALGFRGIKLHPDYQGFFVDEARLFPFYDAVQAAGLWILFHAGLDRGLPGLPAHASPERLLTIHRAFPRLRIVAAHMGGEENYDETERYLLGRDVYLDTSFVLRKMPPETLRRFFARHPTERILFGSDSPWCDQGGDLRLLLSLPFLSSDQKEKIAGGNAAELLASAAGESNVPKASTSC